MARPRPKTGTLYDQGEWLRVPLPRAAGKGEDAAGRATAIDTWVVRAGPRGATPIVLLHGIPTSAYLYRDVMTALHEERDCVAFDWPGFGSSAKPKGLDPTHEARATHLAALMDTMALGEVDLVVHDMGGPAGLLYAMRHPARIRRLVILNTTVFKRDYKPPIMAVMQFIPGVRELSRPFFTRPAFDYVFKEGLARPERMQRGVLETYWKLARQEGGTRAILDTWAKIPEGGDAIREIREKMVSFPKPVLVLFGAEDPFLPPPNAERFAKSFPHAELQLLPGAGHFLQEDAPEEVAECILKFLG